MKFLPPILLLALLTAARAHDHIEIGENPVDPSQLLMEGPAFQLALWVPRGEPFSGYFPDFPGASFACELTFSTETNALEFATGSLARVELVSVSGPAGGSFSFWQTGTPGPIWTRPTGWTAAGDDRPFVVVYEDPTTGYGHLHGRAFTADREGTYTVTFRAVDETGLRTPSPVKTVTFRAQAPPALTLSVGTTNARLAFTTRLNLSYDLQVCENLATDQWTTIASWWDGAATAREFFHPIGPKKRAFYRLVEYW